MAGAPLPGLPVGLKGPQINWVPRAQDRQRGTCHHSGRTFQELAEVKVVLHDHVWDHLLVEADDLEQHGFQKNGFCII